MEKETGRRRGRFRSEVRLRNKERQRNRETVSWIKKGHTQLLLCIYVCMYLCLYVHLCNKPKQTQKTEKRKN